MTDVGNAERAKVFISYSRRDSADFAEELVAGLQLAGFAAFLDHHDIAAGEDWEVRLGGLIRQADSIVFVVSPEAVKSQRCVWEVDRAFADAKRVLPVIFKTVPDADIPHKLQRRQFVRFDTGQGINRPLALLVDALRQDLDWLREHTRLSESAARWKARGKPESLLLRGDDLAAAKSWLDARKDSAPPITDLLRDFLSASGEAETVRLAGAKTARRRLHQAQAFAVFCALVFVAALTAWWNQDWLRERVYAAANVHPLTAAQEQTLAPKQSFKECTDCPEMVVVPAGSFVMGSPPNEPGHKPDEGPQHSVTLANAFAVSKFELTFSAWDACAAHGECDPRVSDGGFGRNAQPVINVTWSDAQQYAAWLSDVTGQPYRLLSEAEYEYAARAGSQAAYPWGDDIDTGKANCIDCGGQWDGRQPAPVGSFAANAFGLYDMIGNVWEWVEDCGHNDYTGAPQNGAAWITDKNCGSRVARGGTFNVLPTAVRSGSRLLLTSQSLYFNLGFRVARNLIPKQ